MSDKSNKLKVESVVKWVPWDAKGSDDAREAARRVASVLQARAFFVTTILERKPANTMAEGMVGMLLATNTTLVEELVYGFLRHSIGLNVKRRGVAGLIDDCESDGVISAKTTRSLNSTTSEMAPMLTEKRWRRRCKTSHSYRTKGWNVAPLLAMLDGSIHD